MAYYCPPRPRTCRGVGADRAQLGSGCHCCEWAAECWPRATVTERGQWGTGLVPRVPKLRNSGRNQEPGTRFRFRASQIPVPGSCPMQAVWETPFSAHLRRSRPDGRRCRGPKGRGSRCEAARAAIRFGGLRLFMEDVLKCTIAPGFRREGDPSSPSFSPSSPFQPAAWGPKGAVALSRWPTIGYFFTLLLTMISHSPSTP